MEICRKQRATLVIAKLDRLARNVHFISGLMEAGAGFVAVDQRTKDRFMLHLQAAFAEEEARRISVRINEALATAKARGVEIGATGKARAAHLKKEAQDRALELAPVIAGMRTIGTGKVRQIRDELNRRKIPSPGGGQWHLPTTHRMLHRMRLVST